MEYYPINNLVIGKNNMKNRENIRSLVLAAMFLAIAYVLPFVTGQIPQVGNMLCPMHIPVLLCGFICGPWWGVVVGMTVPLLRSVTLGMPVIFPQAVCMAVELAVYGAIVGLLYQRLPKKKICIYVSLLFAMTAGRIAWGIAMYGCLGMKGESFGISAFLAGAVINAIPGIILQIVLIPVFIMFFEKRHLKDEIRMEL